MATCELARLRWANDRRRLARGILATAKTPEVSRSCNETACRTLAPDETQLPSSHAPTSSIRSAAGCALASTTMLYLSVAASSGAKYVLTCRACACNGGRAPSPAASHVHRSSAWPQVWTCLTVQTWVTVVISIIACQCRAVRHALDALALGVARQGTEVARRTGWYVFPSPCFQSPTSR